jgi:hypothetical protein
VINCEVNSSKEADFWRIQAEVRTRAGNGAFKKYFLFLFFLLPYIMFLRNQVSFPLYSGCLQDVSQEAWWGNQKQGICFG